MKNETIIPRAETTKESIIQAAHRLFVESGYHGTSMRQIAQASGIALGGIYNHFPGKEGIFIAVLLAHHPMHDVLPTMLAAHGETLEAFVRDAATRMVAKMDDRLDFLNLMFIELVEFNGQHLPSLFKVFIPQVMEFAERFNQGSEQLKPIPIPILIRAFIGLFFSFVMTELLLGKQMPANMQTNALNYFIDIFLYGILKEGDYAEHTPELYHP